MRVGMAQSYQSQVSRMNDLQSTIDRLQSQIASGKRVQDPSDDPLGASRVATLQRGLDDNSQFITNMNNVTTRLSLADSAAEGMSNLMIRARELTIQAANGTMTGSDRSNISSELGQIIDQMMSLANSRDDQDQYLFAGAQSGSPAFAKDANGHVVWQGSGDPVAVRIGPDVTVASSASGMQMLKIPTSDGQQSIFTMMENLKAALDAPAPVTDADRQAFQDSMDSALDGMNAAVDRLSDQRAVFGARLAQVDAETDRLNDLGVTMKTAQSSIESLDVPAAITELQSAMTLLQASQQSFAQIKKLSLFDYLG
jgi:flagellar hook-associated protein 3 FlgL